MLAENGGRIPRAIGRKDLNGKAFKVGYYDMAFLQILWSQNETRRMPNPLTQFPERGPKPRRSRAASRSSRPKWGRAAPAARVAITTAITTVNGVVNDTFQDYNIHEPGVVAETTVDNDGVFLRLGGRLSAPGVRAAAGSGRPAEHQQPQYQAPAQLLGQRAAMAASWQRAHDPRDSAAAGFAAAAAGRARIQLPHGSHR